MCQRATQFLCTVLYTVNNDTLPVFPLSPPLKSQLHSTTLYLISLLTRQHPAPYRPTLSKSTLSATYLYLAWHRLTMNWNEMSPNTLVTALFVSFHVNVHGHLLVHANVLISAEEMFSLRGEVLATLWTAAS